MYKKTNNFGLFRYTLYKYVVGGNNNHDCICSMSKRESPEKMNERLPKNKGKCDDSEG